MSLGSNSPLELHSADSSDSSLRGRIADSHEAIQNKNQSRDSATLKASSGAGVGVVREGEGSDFAIQAPTPSLKENVRGQKGEFNADLSAESRKEMDSRFALDSRDLDSSLTSFAQNDEFFVDCFGDESPRNDEFSTNYFDSPLPNLAITNLFHNPPQRLNRAF